MRVEDDPGHVPEIVVAELSPQPHRRPGLEARRLAVPPRKLVIVERKPSAHLADRTSRSPRADGPGLRPRSLSTDIIEIPSLRVHRFRPGRPTRPDWLRSAHQDPPDGRVLGSLGASICGERAVLGSLGAFLV